jgi:CubicO group peptidase (beta-lactamase class C family)
MRYRLASCLVLCAVLLAGCTQLAPPSAVTPSALPTVAYWPAAGWQRSAPEEQGMDSQRLAEAVDWLRDQDRYRIHSLTVVRHGYLVLDAYFYPFSAGSLHDVASVTKSLMSTLVGIAVTRGDIPSVDAAMLGFFEGREVANRDGGKESITVKNLLHMNAGLQCTADPTELTLIEMMQQPDWVQYALDLPMSAAPGRSWVYCSPGVHLLSALLQQATGQSSADFARQQLFDPLGFGDVVWPADPQGVNLGYGDVRMTAHDMARLGYLYLAQGEWDSRRLLSADWVSAATIAPQGPQPGGSGYGYLWWLTADGYAARGRGGQYIRVLPQQDMVVVTTGGGGSSWDTLETLLSSYLKPAVKSELSIRANAAGVAALQATVERAAGRPPYEPLPPAELPAVAQAISGRTYRLEDNAFNLQTLSVFFEQEDEALITITNTGQPAGDPRFEWRIGLDDLERLHPGRFDMPAAAKGSWQSEDTFSFEVDEIGNNNRWRVTLRFESSCLSGRFEDVTGFFPTAVEFAGRLQE